MITSIDDIAAIYNSVWIGINAYNASTLLRRRDSKGSAAVATDEELQEFKNSNIGRLPKASVLLPAYKENGVLQESVEALERSDYPKGSFEVLVLLEKGDYATQEVAEKLTKRFENVKMLIIEEEIAGKGKPRALNYGLARASGSIVGVVDAEDIVDKRMLLESAYMIQERHYDAVQGVLDMTNEGDGWKNMMQRAEYGYWYNYYLHALLAAKYPMPFGGTTNFFKKDVLQKLGGWDSKSLTEDFDLGLRFFNSGAGYASSSYKTKRLGEQQLQGMPFKSDIYTAEFYKQHAADYSGTSLSGALGSYNSKRELENQKLIRGSGDKNRVTMISSITNEESPVTTKAWLRQRTRWQQGKIQAMRKNLRDPPEGVSKKVHTFMATVQPHIAVINITGIAITVYAYLTNALIEPVKILADLNLGMVAIYAAMNGVGYLDATAREKETIKYRRTKAVITAVTTPAYWVMQWVADLRAMKLEYIDGSTAWDKTEHLGRHFNATANAMSKEVEGQNTVQEQVDLNNQEEKH